jgi:hypothetical protein
MLDFVWGHDAPQKIYYPLMQQLDALMPPQMPLVDINDNKEEY